MARRPATRSLRKSSPETWPHMEAVRLSWLFTTLEAHKNSGSALMTEHIGRLIVLDADMQFRVRFSLQEAVINALFHGNLGLPSLPASVTGLDEFGKELEKRLTIPALAQKTISVVVTITREAVDIAVRDEGEGFSKRDTVIHNPFFGRGLRLVEQCADAVEYDQETRTLRVFLKRTPEGVEEP